MIFFAKFLGFRQLLTGFARGRAQADAVLQARLYVMGELILAESQRLVPRDTGHLASTAFLRRSGSKHIEIGYDADYALIVHEVPPDRASHAAPTQYKFLEIPARRFLGNADRDLQDMDPFKGAAWWTG